MKRFIKVGVIFLLIVIVYIFLMEKYVLKYNGIKYEIIDGGISIIGIANKKVENIELPENIGASKVTRINDKAFYTSDNLKGEIIIPSSVMYIGNFAFDQCSNLHTIKLLGDAPQISSNTFGSNIQVKYPYLATGYDKEEWTNVNLKPYNVPITEVEIQNIADVKYTGQNVPVKITAKFKNKNLIENTDYTLEYKNNKDAGTATVVICGIGDYISKTEMQYKITPKDIQGLTFSRVDNAAFTGKDIIPEIVVKDGDIKLTQDVDYTLQYKNNKNAGTATIEIKGIGNYTGTKKIAFKITKININNVVIQGLANKAYTGSKISQSLKITFNDITLTKGKDYTLTYSNNINLGTATVTVQGIGNYTGSKKLTYKITARDVSTLSYSKVKNQKYTGSEIRPNVTVKYSGNTLQLNKDYKISYKNNKKVGTGKIIITGIGNYTGTKEISFNIDKEAYYIKVNLKANVVTIYQGVDGNYDTPVKAMICSTGTDTPRSGKYTIKSRWSWLKLYGGVYGHYVTQITGDILFHSVPYLSKSPDTLEYWEYDKLGTKASLGCVRLTAIDAKWIYDNISRGTIVEFYSSSNPGPLGKPTAMKITQYKEYRNWDPTDPSSKNPWKNFVENDEKEEQVQIEN